jgi:hypothetical protein
MKNYLRFFLFFLSSLLLPITFISHGWTQEQIEISTEMKNILNLNNLVDQNETEQNPCSRIEIIEENQEVNSSEKLQQELKLSLVKYRPEIKSALLHQTKQYPAPLILGDTFNYKSDRKHLKWELCGILTAALGSFIANATGFQTTVHEICGHMWLGQNLMLNASEPIPVIYNQNVQIDGWDNYYQIKDFDSLIKFLFGNDFHNDGNSGYAINNIGRIPFSNLGNKLSQLQKLNQIYAWISLSGSLSVLAMNILISEVGQNIYPHIPYLGTHLYTFAMISHALASSYPISTSLKKNEINLNKNPNSGHDFDNFYFRTHKDPSLTAFYYSALIPFISLLHFFNDRTDQADIFSNYEALHLFLQKAAIEGELPNSKKEELEKILLNNPRLADLLKSMERPLPNNAPFINEEDLKKAADLEETRIQNKKEEIEYLVSHLQSQLTTSEIRQLKLEKLKEYAPELQTFPFYPILKTINNVGFLSTIVMPLNRALKQNELPGASTTFAAFTSLFPLWPLMSASMSGYKAKEYIVGAARSQIPLVTKIFSGLEFASDITQTAILTQTTHQWLSQPDITDIDELLGSWQLPTVFCLRGFSSICGYVQNVAMRSFISEKQNQNLNK